jgi:hypothetical protein
MSTPSGSKSSLTAKEKPVTPKESRVLDGAVCGTSKLILLNTYLVRG